MREGRARAVPWPGLWVWRLGVEEEDSPSFSINVSQVDLEQSIIKAEETLQAVDGGSIRQTGHRHLQQANQP